LKHKKLFIQGVTSSGKPFRPSDWAERLCGVMASFRPPGDHADPRFTFSPYARPIQIAQIKCVVIDTRLHFAKDNDLAIEEACEFEPKSQTHT
jgi:hypothetical protein